MRSERNETSSYEVVETKMAKPGIPNWRPVRRNVPLIPDPFKPRYIPIPGEPEKVPIIKPIRTPSKPEPVPV